MEWLEEHIEGLWTQLSPGSKAQIEYLLRSIARTSFKNLALRYTEIVKELSAIELEHNWLDGWELTYNI